MLNVGSSPTVVFGSAFKLRMKIQKVKEGFIKMGSTRGLRVRMFESFVKIAALITAILFNIERFSLL